jgi:hypothetical protein
MPSVINQRLADALNTELANLLPRLASHAATKLDISVEQMSEAFNSFSLDAAPAVKGKPSAKKQPECGECSYTTSGKNARTCGKKATLKVNGEWRCGEATGKDGEPTGCYKKSLKKGGSPKSKTKPDVEVEESDAVVEETEESEPVKKPAATKKPAEKKDSKKKPAEDEEGEDEPVKKPAATKKPAVAKEEKKAAPAKKPAAPAKEEKKAAAKNVKSEDTSKKILSAIKSKTGPAQKTLVFEEVEDSSGAKHFVCKDPKHRVILTEENSGKVYAKMNEDNEVVGLDDADKAFLEKNKLEFIDPDAQEEAAPVVPDAEEGDVALDEEPEETDE